MREQFEAAWRERYPMHADEGLIRSRVDPESYVNTRTKDGWWAWQASRAALVVELPQIVAYEAGYDSLRDNEYASQSGEFFDADEVFALHRSDEVRAAIEAAGVTVKVAP